MDRGSSSAEVEALVKQGEEAYAQERYALACRSFERALEVQPDLARARQDLGVTCLALGDAARARRELEAAVACDPGSALARINLARASAALRDASSAWLQLAAALVCRDGEALVREHAEVLAAIFDPGIVALVAEASWRGIPADLLGRLGALLGIAVREQPGNARFDRQLRRHRDVVELVHRHRGADDPVLLDVGCGNGGLLRELARIGYRRLHGCDLAPGLRSAELPGLRIERVDLDAHGLAAYTDASFDAVVCCDVLEHLEGPAFALRELARVMRPDAQLFLTIPNAFNRFERLEILRTGNSTRYPRSKPEARGHITVLPSHVLASLCDRAGLELREEATGYCFLHGYFWFPERRFTHTDAYVCAYRIGKQRSR